MNRRCQRFFLIRQKEPDLAPQCGDRDRRDVVDADDAVLFESVAHADRNFGRQAPDGSCDRCDGNSGEVRPHEFPSQDQNRAGLVELGNVDRSQSISSSKVEARAASASKSSSALPSSARILASRAAISRRCSRWSALSTNDARLSLRLRSTSLSMNSTTSSGRRTAICLLTPTMVPIWDADCDHRVAAHQAPRVAPRRRRRRPAFRRRGLARMVAVHQAGRGMRKYPPSGRALQVEDEAQCLVDCLHLFWTGHSMAG